MKRASSMEQLHSAARPAPARPTALHPLLHSAAALRSSVVARANIHNFKNAVAQPLELGCSMARHLSYKSLQALHAISSSGSSTAVAAASAAALDRSDSEDLSFDLDWRPNLSLTQEVIAWSCAAAFTCLVYCLTAPASLSIPYGTCMGLVFGFSLYLLRGKLLEELFKARERIEADLGDADSRFRQLSNLLVHVKVQASKTLPPPVAQSPAAARYAPVAPSSSSSSSTGSGSVPAIHCYHGFGSNTWSWSLVQQGLAERLGALVTAHDMPGFGLTQRPNDLSSYYLAFNGRLGRLAMDYEAAIRGLLSMKEATRSGETGYPHTSIHEAAAAAGTAAGQPPPAVQSLEAAAGGTAQQAASRAVESGLEPPLQQAAAAAAEGNVAGIVKGAAAAAKGQVAGVPPAAASGSSAKQQQQSKVKRVLMGHSLGGACAALEFIANPQDYAAVVLVDPAIIAGLGGPGENDQPGSPIKLEKLQDGTIFTRSLASGDFANTQSAAAAAAAAAGAAAAASRSSSSSIGSDGGGSVSADLDDLAAAQGNLTRSNSSSNAATGSSGGSSSQTRMQAAAAAGDVVLYATRGDDAVFEEVLLKGDGNNANAAVKLLTTIIGLIRSFFMLTTLLAISAMRPIIVVLLRMAVRSRKFWANTLQQAYYDKSKVTPAAVDAYRLPQLVRGWEAGMVQFLMARLGGGGSRAATTAASAAGAAPPGGLEDAGLANRFAAAVAAAGTPVLIVHGAADKLVPASNSFKLARLIKGCKLAVVKKAGHCPQEEEPQVFEDVVCGFLKKQL